MLGIWAGRGRRGGALDWDWTLDRDRDWGCGQTTMTHHVGGSAPSNLFVCSPQRGCGDSGIQAGVEGGRDARECSV